MPLTHFHPVIRRWFSETLGEPTAAQQRGWASIREQRHTLIAAPTGSGKTLAAFLTALDDLFQEGLRGPLPDEVRVVYVSPLKALSADIHKNLAEPRTGIRRIAIEMGLEAPHITAAVRTGDTTTSERAAMLKRPPHILVTTPESLYLLLTAERSREMLRTARTVIVDEIHAVIGTRRGAHLAITLERLQQIAHAPLLRLGLSATQKPIEEVARYLVGAGGQPSPGGRGWREAPGEGPGVDSASESKSEEESQIAPGSTSHDVSIIDEGHKRVMDLTLEIPRSNLESVMSHEVWENYYDRLTELITAHRTTLIFVNTRRMAERVARHLSDRIGEDAVTAHHGSLSKENRLDAENRLKGGRLKALVATASLELGIDIGHVDLVCQIGSPHRITTLLQRVGRSGHTVSGMPKGRLFPVSRDDLMECAALLRAVRRGELDRIVTQEAPLDVLAQQVVAESACDDYSESDLFALMRRAWPYRDLTRQNFDAVVAMVSDGFATRRGRRGALVHRDEVNGNVKGRRGSRMLAITSGGAIPEVADYRVLLEPDDTFIGTLNEDFAIESSAGDIFQLGNTSWLILQVGSGVVRVADARGAPPTIPFWLGEAPARSDELSRAVSDLRRDIDERLACHPERGGREGVSEGSPSQLTSSTSTNSTAADEILRFAQDDSRVEDTTVQLQPEEPRNRGTEELPEEPVIAWLIAETGMPEEAAREAIAYLADSRLALGVLPTQQTLVLERFFDESGGMQLVLHAPFGSRINKAWGLALRKRFCRQFNFELQAAATEDAVLLSLGPQHSFPLADVFRYLHPNTARDILVQAFLDAPVFQTRWRWNTTISLAIPRNRNGRKVPPPLQRAMADDLMAAVFPDAAACLENVAGDRKLPDHPLVNQVVRDCLEEAMDFAGLSRVLTSIHSGEIRCEARDTPEPSPLSHEILNARPYAFLDDAPLEERRTQGLYARRATEASSADALGTLDSAAIERVRDEERPDPRDADELHDALLTAGFLSEEEVADLPDALMSQLVKSRRAGAVTTECEAPTESGAAECGDSTECGAAASAASGRGPGQSAPNSKRFWVAAERLPEILAVHPAALTDHKFQAPPSRASRTWTREEALVELLRGRLTILGPSTAVELSVSMAVTASDVDTALLSLESEGAVLRGTFSPRLSIPAAHASMEWCDRRLLARIHRYTINRLRAEIEPASPAEFMRFLLDWHHLTPPAKLSGVDGLRRAMGQLDGFELAAGAWERFVLPARIDRYETGLLDTLCLTGEVGWARLTPATSPPTLTMPSPIPASPPALGGATPVALFLREQGAAWQALREDSSGDIARQSVRDRKSADAIAVDSRSQLVTAPAGKVLEILRTRGASFFRELLPASGLPIHDLEQALGELAAAGLVTSDGFAGLRALIRNSHDRRTTDVRGDVTGRWSLLASGESALARDAAVESQARALLRRYGVIFRRLLTREPNAAPWRELARVYRRLEARGEIRGGRFVTSMSGEQFALAEAVDRLRELRREGPGRGLVTINATDPLNLTGIITAGERVRAIAANRIAYRDGVAVSVMEGEYLRPLMDLDHDAALEAAAALTGRRVSVSSGFVGAPALA